MGVKQARREADNSRLSVVSRNFWSFYSDSTPVFMA